MYCTSNTTNYLHNMHKPVDVVEATVLGGWGSSSKTVTRCVETEQLVQPSFAQVATPVPGVAIVSLTWLESEYLLTNLIDSLSSHS